MDKFDITTQNSVYVLIDLQTNLASAMKKEVIDNVERNVGLMISGCHALKVPILVTEQYRKGLGPWSESRTSWRTITNPLIKRILAVMQTPNS
jgi:hypothetical protein